MIQVYNPVVWGCGGMADTADLKSADSDIVRVQVPSAPVLTAVRPTWAVFLCGGMGRRDRPDPALDGATIWQKIC